MIKFNTSLEGYVVRTYKGHGDFVDFEDKFKCYMEDGKIKLSGVISEREEITDLIRWLETARDVHKLNMQTEG
jgi:hypothetical protein